MLTGLSLQTVALLALGGVLLDLLLGETRRWHPLVGFGTMAGAIERKLNQGNAKYLRGLCAWLIAVFPAVLVAYAVLGVADAWLAAALHALLLYFCIGLRSLRDHTAPIEAALLQGDLPAARSLTARIVSRDTAHADAGALAKAGVE